MLPDERICQNCKRLMDRRRDEDRGLAQRHADSSRVYRETRDPRAAVREYCRGNRWLEENAKAVGNWD
jgi:hypothetical protein